MQGADFYLACRCGRTEPLPSACHTIYQAGPFVIRSKSHLTETRDLLGPCRWPLESLVHQLQSTDLGHLCLRSFVSDKPAAPRVQGPNPSGLVHIATDQVDLIFPRRPIAIYPQTPSFHEVPPDHSRVMTSFCHARADSPDRNCVPVPQRHDSGRRVCWCLPAANEPFLLWGKAPGMGADRLIR